MAPPYGWDTPACSHTVKVVCGVAVVIVIEPSLPWVLRPAVVFLSQRLDSVACWSMLVVTCRGEHEGSTWTDRQTWFVFTVDNGDTHFQRDSEWGNQIILPLVKPLLKMRNRWMRQRILLKNICQRPLLLPDTSGNHVLSTTLWPVESSPSTPTLHQEFHWDFRGGELSL